MASNEQIRCCSDCKHFWYESACSTQPYPEFGCTKNKWDGVTSTDDLLIENKCKEFEVKGQDTTRRYIYVCERCGTVRYSDIRTISKLCANGQCDGRAKYQGKNKNR